MDHVSSMPPPFVAGLQMGGITLIIFFLLHKFFVFLTPEARRLNRPTTPLPPVANIKDKPSNKETISVVVGGSGFLGTHITRQLAARGDKVRVVDLSKGKEANVEYIIASILDEDKLADSFRDAKVVYHTASILEFNNFPLSYDINVVGTRHVINACLRAGVTRLVYTSSIAVVMDGKDCKSGDETSLTYTQTHLTPYGTTKAIAEIMVLRSNGTSGLRTVALRPPGLYGPGESYFVAGLADPKSPNISGSVIQDFMYIENAAHCHILAGDKLTEGSPLAGQYYFIGDEPKNCKEFIRQITRQLGIPDQFSVPKYLGYFMAVIIEGIYLFAGGYFTNVLFMLNIGIVRSSHLNFHVSTAKAEKEIGYKPLCSTQEAVDRTVEFLRTLTDKFKKDVHQREKQKKEQDLTINQESVKKSTQNSKLKKK